MKVKNIIVFLLVLILSLGLFFLLDVVAFQRAMYTAGLTENSKEEDIGQIMEVQIVDINDNILLVRPTSEVVDLGQSAYGYWEYIYDYSDILEIDLDGVEINCELFADKIVDIVYHHSLGTTGNNPIHLNKVSEIQDSHLDYWEDIVLYNGRRYSKSWLSEETLNWINMSEEERAKSNHYPEELEKLGRFELSCNIDEWGISLGVDNVTPTGLTMVFKQEDFIPTNKNDNWEYSMASPFEIQKFEYKSWNSVKAKYKSFEVPWSSDIEYIKSNDITRHTVDWEWLYGKLSKGKYRIVKEVKVLKDTHDYDIKKIYLLFEIE